MGRTEANNLHARSERLHGAHVAGVDALVLDEAGDEIHAVHPRIRAERARELDYVSHLTAGVGVAAELDVLAAHETVHAQQEEIVAAGRQSRGGSAQVRHCLRKR